MRLPRAGNPAPEIFLWSRLAIWAAALFSFFVFVPNRHPRAAVWDDPKLTHDLGAITDVWARWDSVWFLRIAEHGYGSAKGAAAAFYPLYPATVALLGRVLFGHYVLAGILVSLAASFVSFLLLYRIAEERLGADGARRAVLYLAVFPFALFLQAVYSESLYLLLTLAAFMLAERRRFLAAGAVTGLALLTRPTAAALLPALALLAWRERDRVRALPRPSRSRRCSSPPTRSTSGSPRATPGSSCTRSASGAGTSRRPARSAGSGTACAPAGPGSSSWRPARTRMSTGRRCRTPTRSAWPC